MKNSSLSTLRPFALGLPALAMCLTMFGADVPFGSCADTAFAVIGDYGLAGLPELDVSNLVKSWAPDFIVTVGDNNYPSGAAATIDANIGQYYHDFIYPYTGSYGAGAPGVNDFFPIPGNHDWYTAGAAPYLAYFTLPGNERYYDFVRGPVHFFMLDSDTNEPDGTSSSSIQAAWLQAALAASVSPWKLVLIHHAPWSSGSVHGPTAYTQWPYQAWGATATLSGHEHTYERIIQGGYPYFVNGLGGDSKYSFGTVVAGSQVRYNTDYGAMLVEATDACITFRFISRGGVAADAYSIYNGFPIRLNFQPAASTLPGGYIPSDGSAYGLRGAFGWR